MYRYFNSNPVAAREQDCAIRAVSAALGISWDEAFDLIAYNAKQMGATMNNNAAWGGVLRQHGFKRYIVPDYSPIHAQTATAPLTFAMTIRRASMCSALILIQPPL